MIEEYNDTPKSTISDCAQTQQAGLGSNRIEDYSYLERLKRERDDCISSLSKLQEKIKLLEQSSPRVNEIVDRVTRYY